MKTLKRTISRYMLQTIGMMVVVIFSIVLIILISLENRRSYESSVGVVAQMKQFLDNEAAVAEKEEAGRYSYLFTLIKTNSAAEYYAISAEDGRITDATEKEGVGAFCEEIGLSFDKVTKDTDGFYAKINGRLFFCYFERMGADYVGRCARCTTMYQRIPSTILVLGLSLMTIAFALAYTVTRYMNRYVVDGIGEINDELCRITEGDMEVKVDVRTSEEFSELSDYINTMVSSLSDTTSKISYVLSKTNMFIGVYEYRKGAKPVHCTEYIPRIFSMELEEWRLLTSDYELFEQYIENVRTKPQEGENGVYKLSEEPEQYVKLEEMEIGKEVFGVVIDVTDEVMKRKQIETERDVDLLTGLYNRRGMEAQISLLFRKPEIMRRAALVMIDADGLKGINDTYGHEMGDAYLKKVGNVINNFGIQSSLSARVGGDEFVLFLYDYDDEDELLNTIRTIEYIQGHSTARLNDNLTVPLRFSFGYCMLEKGLSYEEMLKAADERMYANKRKRKKEAAQEGK